MRVIEIAPDGTIKLAPQDLEELKINPGDEYILAKEGDILTLTPLNSGKPQRVSQPVSSNHPQNH